MEPIKLLPLEVAIYEGLKSGKSMAQIKSEAEVNVESSNLAGRLSWLVKSGVITATGGRRKRTYQVKDITYETVLVRTASKEEKQDAVPDTLLAEMQQVKLNDGQRQFLRENYNNLTRSELSKKLGVSKLELSYVMHQMGLRQKENKREAAVAKR